MVIEASDAFIALSAVLGSLVYAQLANVAEVLIVGLFWKILSYLLQVKLVCDYLVLWIYSSRLITI